MAQKVELKLLGKTYQLKDDDPEVDLTEVVGVIERMAAEIEHRYPKLPPLKVLVLLVTNLGKELYVTRKQLESAKEKINLKLDRISKKIDSHVVEKIN